MIINAHIDKPLELGDKVILAGDPHSPGMVVCQIQQGIAMCIWFNPNDGNPTPMQLAAPVEALRRANLSQSIH